MISKGWQSAVDSQERALSNCFACGRSVEQVRTMPRHNPEPGEEADRCMSRPRKYSHLRCMYAAGHDCAHTAKVVGTGRTFWSDGDSS
jgi:hypothetical protein